MKKLKNLNILKDIFPFLWIKKENVRILFLYSFCLVFISIAFNLSIPLVLKEIVSWISSPHKSMTYQLSLLLIAYGIIWTFSQVTQQIRQIILIRPLEKSIRIFCSKLFEHLISLPMKFHLDEKIGSISNALERAQHGFQDVFWGLFLFIVPTVVELFIATSILCYFYGIIYGLILILTVVIFIAFTYYAIERASYFQTLSNEKQLITNASIVDSLLNIASIKYFNNKKHEIIKCNHHLEEREKSLVKAISNMEFIRIGQSVIIGIGIILLTYTAGKQALLNVYDVSDFILVNGYILQFAAPLNHMGFIARDIRRGINELANTLEILRTKPLESFPPRIVYPIKKLTNIEFQNVCFYHDPLRFILKDISFNLKKGTITAIVGTTGSGKSTISNLLYKFYEINSGKIWINNKEIKDIETESLLNLIGIVPQDITLFNTTIYENILFARPSAHQKEVEKVIKLALLDPVLEKLPLNYNTIVGERGLKLSGGEKQRIAIARILLKRPSLYIFDEATSSLDFSTEEQIMKNINPILKNSASLIIAHRLSTVVHADEILVLDDGTIKERGTHFSLLKQKGLYAFLWEKHEEIHKK